MKFDITKVVYITYEGKLSSTVKIGTKGYFADTLTNLRYYVEKECELHTTLKSGSFLFSLQRLNLHNQLTSNRLCSD